MELNKTSDTSSKPRFNPWLITAIVLAVALIAGGVVFAWQRSVNDKVKNDLRGQINTLQNQVQQLSKITPIDETADWQTYTNSKYGFTIKYPNNFKIIAEGAGDYHQEKGICSIVYEVKFRDSNKPKRAWEAEGEPRESTIDLRVAEADCPSIFDEKAYSVKYPFPQSVLKIANDLLNFGFSKNRIYGQAFGVGVSWDESGELLYGCEDITLVKMDSNFAVVKESKCSTGPIYPETDAYILSHSGNFIFSLYDAASDYQQDGSFDQILSTFKFTK